MSYRGKIIHQNNINVIYTGKKKSNQWQQINNRGTAVTVSPTQYVQTVELKVFQEGACEYNYSIWLKSTRDKSDAWIISQTAQHVRGLNHSQNGHWVGDKVAAGHTSWSARPHMAVYPPFFFLRSNHTLITSEGKCLTFYPLNLIKASIKWQ